MKCHICGGVACWRTPENDPPQREYCPDCLPKPRKIFTRTHWYGCVCHACGEQFEGVSDGDEPRGICCPKCGKSWKGYLKD